MGTSHTQARLQTAVSAPLNTTQNIFIAITVQFSISAYFKDEPMGRLAGALLALIQPQLRLRLALFPRCFGSKHSGPHGDFKTTCSTFQQSKKKEKD